MRRVLLTVGSIAVLAVAVTGCSRESDEELTKPPIEGATLSEPTNASTPGSSPQSGSFNLSAPKTD